MIRFSKGLIVKPYTWVFYGSLQGKQAGCCKIVGAIIFGLLQESESILAYLKATHFLDRF
ncbi:MAG: hypothetical protein DWH95_04050 [Planctomycetota bacterium]|nr:MAG: hypothetical protein DWH95_04050 [Planctomycetota bacterium]